MSIEFHGPDVVTNFAAPAQPGIDHYVISYTCGNATVTHRVDQADYQSENGGTRTYHDTLTYAENLAAGLTRTPTVNLVTVLASGKASTALTEYAQNSIPVLASAPQITPTRDGVLVSLPTPSDLDLAGYRAWVGSTSGVPLDDAHKRYDGAGNSFVLPLSDDRTYYLRVAPYDRFGFDPASAWSEIAIQRAAPTAADTTPPAVPAKPTISSTIDAKSGLVNVQIAWVANTDSDLAYYDVNISTAGGGYVSFLTASPAYGLSGQFPNTSVSAKVRAFDTSGNVSAFSAVTTATTVKDTTPPGPVANLQVASSLGTTFVIWDNPSDLDLAGFTIFEGASSDFSKSYIAGQVNGTPGGYSRFTRAGLANGQTLYYWVQAYDTSANYSTITGPKSVRTPDLTMDAAALSGTITSGQIGVGVIPSILASQSLSAPHVVSTNSINDGSIVAPIGGALAYNVNDGVLYRNTDGGNLAKAWSPTVASVLAANSVVAGTVAAAAITSRELQSGSVTASKVAVVADNLNPDPNFTDPLLYNQVSADNTQTGTVGYPAGDLNGAHGWYLEVNQSYLTSINGPPKGISLYDVALQRKDTRNHLYGINPTAIPLVGGKTYELSAFIHNASSQTGYIQIDLFKFVNDANGNPVLTYTGMSPQVAAIGGGSQDGTRTVVFTAPAGTAGGRVVAFNHGQAYGGSTFLGSITVGNVQVREQNGGTMIVDGAISSRHITVGTLDGDRIRTNSLSASAIVSTDSLPGTLSITNTGFSLSTLASTASSANTTAGQAKTTADTANGTANTAYGWANDPAARVNANNSTQINPGLINISGGTTLANWRDGGDTSKIWGGAISANTIAANTGTFGNRNIQVNGLDIHYDAPSNSLVWGAGDVTYINDAGSGNEGFGINAGSRQWPGQVCYLWINRGNSQLYCDPNNNVGNPNDFQIGRWYGGTNFNITYGRTLVENDRIRTGSITADRMNVTSLSSLSANVGDLYAGRIRGPGDATYLDIGANYFRFSADQFLIHSPGNVINPVFTWNGSSLQLRNVNIDGGTINAQSVNTAQLTVGGVATDRLADNSVTNGDFIVSSSVFYGQGGVSVNASGYSVN